MKPHELPLYYVDHLLHDWPHVWAEVRKILEGNEVYPTLSKERQLQIRKNCLTVACKLLRVQSISLIGYDIPASSCKAAYYLETDVCLSGKDFAKWSAVGVIPRFRMSY